ncbi:VanZ family protein [Neorhizobium sp. JUb45]|uniref:VanZ family protein n=1 Tax=unclassified Neorhizobium TaxID=2629175 RepID=UPI001052B841|nr:VanZ family protein [Neorhizobium sp. JUb45]TCR06763.1 VanZ like protein [Neorhizobium sp. JUb45]
MTRTLLKTLPWLVLAFVIFATVSPIEMRPHDFLPVNVDRAGAFAVMAFLFVITYPRHWKLCAVLLLLGAGGIELLQFISPSRHANPDDALIKAAGAAIGCVAGWGVNLLRTRTAALS